MSFERAIAILEDVLGEDHVKVANARAERGTMLVRLGRYGEAVGECHAAIHICSKRLGRKHAMVAHLKGQVGFSRLLPPFLCAGGGLYLLRLWAGRLFCTKRLSNSRRPASIRK